VPRGAMAGDCRRVAVQAPAWRVLREVANNFVKDGQWEPVGDGYSLSGAQLVAAKMRNAARL